MKAALLVCLLIGLLTGEITEAMKVGAKRLNALLRSKRCCRHTDKRKAVEKRRQRKEVESANQEPRS